MSAVHNARQRVDPPAPIDRERIHGADRCFPRLSHGAGTTYEVALQRGPEDARLARQVRRLTDRVVAEFPRDRRAALLIAGVPSDNHAADVAGLFARELANRFRGKTLLVDADGEHKVLSQRFAAVGERALADILIDQLPPRRAILPSLVPNLDVLPYGDASPTRRTLEPTRVRLLIDGLKKSHAYVIVSAGGCQDIVTETLARCCDATYLVLQLGKTERLQAAATESYFAHAGARLMGAIVTGVS